MRKFFQLIILLGITFSVQISATELDIKKVQAFSKLLITETKENPKSIFKHLSPEVVIEQSMGSELNGFTFNYNKEEYIKVFNKNFSESDSQEDQKVEVLDLKLIGHNQGQFTVRGYSQRMRRYVWSILDVGIENNKVKIIKISTSNNL